MGGNMAGYWFGWDRNTLADSNFVTDIWNFNIIRLNCYIRGYHRSHEKHPGWITYDNSNNTEEIIDGFTRRGVVVLIEGHDWLGRGIDVLESGVRYLKRTEPHAPNNPEVSGVTLSSGQVGKAFPWGSGGDSVVTRDGKTLQYFNSQFHRVMTFPTDSTANSKNACRRRNTGTSAVLQYGVRHIFAQ
jgi:hypothetical protein